MAGKAIGVLVRRMVKSGPRKFTDLQFDRLDVPRQRIALVLNQAVAKRTLFFAKRSVDDLCRLLSDPGHQRGI